MFIRKVGKMADEVVTKLEDLIRHLSGCCNVFEYRLAEEYGYVLQVCATDTAMVYFTFGEHKYGHQVVVYEGDLVRALQAVDPSEAVSVRKNAHSFRSEGDAAKFLAARIEEIVAKETRGKTSDTA